MIHESKQTLAVVPYGALPNLKYYSVVISCIISSILLVVVLNSSILDSEQHFLVVI